MTRLSLPFLVAAATAGAWLMQAPAPASAQTNQVEMFQDDGAVLGNPGATLEQLRDLGVNVLRVTIPWNLIAPVKRPAGFNATDPAAYPSGSWSIWDQVAVDAKMDGIALDFSVSGPAPPWAVGAGQPSPGGHAQWRPSASAFNQFVQAVGRRYSGTYDPTQGKSIPGGANDLPRVSFWEIWNEPNFGGDLAPQATNGSTVPAAAPMYRSLLDAGWSGLQSSGHGRDTILIGNLDARGQSGPPSRIALQGLPGNFAATKPLQFVRTLYCVSSTYKQLRGAAAAPRSCL